MWILIVIQLMAGSATAKNSMPIVYSGVQMQEFSSQESCNVAKNTILKMNQNRNAGEHVMNINSGVLEMKCIQK